MSKDIIPMSFFRANDLLPILDELDTQADAVLASVLVLKNLYWKYAKSSDPAEQSDYAVILREHGVALETDLGIIKLDAELITDERLETWINGALVDAEMAARKDRLDRLMMKMVDLEEAMAELREGLVGDGDSFL
jgi:hypothetical protein